MHTIIMCNGGESASYDGSPFYPVFQAKTGYRGDIDCVVITTSEPHPCKNERGEIWLTYHLGGQLRDDRDAKWREVLDVTLDEGDDIIEAVTIGYAESGGLK